MGLLDDAIREHLELKRRRGADADEVTRLEQEALGPPQRGEFAGATAPAEPAEPAPETADHPVAEPAPDPEPEPEPDPRDTAEEGWLEDAPPAPEEPEEREEVVVEQHTVEYSAPADPPSDADDVLEETPEFLQETPEHDRLWFEQKPPRDFDLDR
jgi:hypothetical protein